MSIRMRVRGYTMNDIIEMAGGVWRTGSFDWYPSGWYTCGDEVRVRFVNGDNELICTKVEFERGSFNNP